ncbi:MAG TPA: IS110 family transposase [Ktedonosporobacter sp.]|nr:IS110 family transposase [Ktedonosporobacter sp.]
MNVIHPSCCGLDVHKKTVVACLIVSAAKGEQRKEFRTFRTMKADLLALVEWLKTAKCTHVAMESTGVYWKPIFNVLEGQMEVLVVNAQHLKAVPGRKTDMRDAEWIADLLQYGLLRPSFIPSAFEREIRELTRYRTRLIQTRSRSINRLHKTLEDTNIKLTSVATDIMGQSAQAILKALLDGQTDPQVLAELAKGKMRAKRELLAQALTGTLEAHHRFLIAEHLTLIESLDERIEQADREVAERLKPYEESITRLDTIPGVNRRSAEVFLAEIGTDIHRFPSAEHLASWTGICPGNNESAGKHFSGKMRKGNRWLRSALVEAANAAARTKNTYLSAQYYRLVGRRGKPKALVALGHTLLVIVYYLLLREEEYQELGGNYFDERDRQAVEKRLVRRLENLGYQVALQPVSSAS